MRFYGFSAEEIATGANAGHLDLDLDPKLAWTLQHRGVFPLNVNSATREMLLRVPGACLIRIRKTEHGRN